MHLRPVISTYGRLVQRPEKTETVEVVNDDAVPIQDQIETLRTKITLKERYNHVLIDELEESREGVATVLQDLYTETEDLRQKLIDALDAEKSAVQIALRTHREHQLALNDTTPEVANNWLEDKLFDCSKQLNTLLYHLHIKRSKLAEMENIVMIIEKWPRPGTLPWELTANLNLVLIDNTIESVNVKRETAQIMNSKYREIKTTLFEERGKYVPNLKNLETQLNFHKAELLSLKKMQDDAAKFREDAEKNYNLTEKESSENRKKRRIRMTRMKKAAQKLMETNKINKINKINKQSVISRVISFGPAKSAEKVVHKIDIKDRIEAKLAEVEKYRNISSLLVETIRVPDLTYIPHRLRTLIGLSERLQNEREAKEQLRDLLIRQRDQMELILFQYKYSGQQKQQEYLATMKAYDEEIEEVKRNMALKQAKLSLQGDISRNIRFAIIALMERLSNTKNTHNHSQKLSKVALNVQLRMVDIRCKRLLQSLHNLQSVFEGESLKSYRKYVKPNPIPNRLVRVGSPVVSEGSDDEDFSDYKILGRAEMKNRSAKFIQQALLRKNLK